MEVAFDERFASQAEEYSLRFTCEHCAHFDEASGVCIHGFPNGFHRWSHYFGGDPPPTILFCKDFDLA